MMMWRGMEEHHVARDAARLRGKARACAAERRRRMRRTGVMMVGARGLMVMVVVLLLAAAAAAAEEETGVGGGAAGEEVAAPPMADPKNFVATHEWQEIPRDMPVPGGLHIKMDMETGQHFAKLPDRDTEARRDFGAIVPVEDDADAAAAADDDETGQGRNAGSTDASAAVDDETLGVWAEKEMLGDSREEMLNKLQSIAQLGEAGTDPTEDPAEVMLRALSQLPQEEQARLGLPEKPLANVLADGPEMRAYREQLKAVWDRRQEILAHAMEEMLKPNEMLTETVDVLNTSTSALDPGSQVIGQLDRLADLVEDIDMARDFHTLGGWPLLLRELSPTRTGATPATRALAATVVGTAVKNDLDFQLWVLEPALDSSRTGVDLLVQSVHDGLAAAPREDAMLLAQRGMYAIGSAARGNVDVQRALWEHTAFPVELRAAMATYSEQREVQQESMPQSSSNSKIAHKALAFVADMIEERRYALEIADELEAQAASAENGADILEAVEQLRVMTQIGDHFGTAEWIEPTAMALETAVARNDVRVVLQALTSLTEQKRLFDRSTASPLATLEVAQRAVRAAQSKLSGVQSKAELFGDHSDFIREEVETQLQACAALFVS